jgi:hypothetical protein
MKFWYALSDNLNNRSGRFVWQTVPSPQSELNTRPETAEINGSPREQLDALAVEMETNAINEALRNPENLALQVLYLNTLILNSNQLPFREGTPEAIKQTVTKSLNQKNFRERVALVSDEAIAAFVASDTQNAILQLVDHPSLVNALSTESKSLILGALKDCSDIAIRAAWLEILDTGLIISFVIDEIESAAQLFAATPEALKSQNVIVKSELLIGLIEVNDETLRGQIINAIPEGDLVRFLSTEPQAIRDLCLVQEDDWLRVNFYGSDILNREVEAIDLFGDYPYIRSHTNGVSYRRSAFGFRSYYQRTLTASRTVEPNEKAFVSHGNYFQVMPEGELWAEEEAALEEAEPISERENEINHELNQAYALNFKVLIESMVAQLNTAELPAGVQNDIITQSTAFRVFLDGDRYLMDGEALSSGNQATLDSSVLSGLELLDYNASPEEVQDIVNQALDRVVNHYLQQRGAIIQRLETVAPGSDESVLLIAQLESFNGMLEAAGQQSREILQVIDEDSVALRDYNRINVDESLSGLGLEEAEIQSWWEEINSATGPEREALVAQMTARLTVLLRNNGSENPASEAAEIVYRLQQQVILERQVAQGVVLTEQLKRNELRGAYIMDQITPMLMTLDSLGIDIPPELQSSLLTYNITVYEVDLLQTLVQENATSLNAWIDSPGSEGAPIALIQGYLDGEAASNFRVYMTGVNAELETENDAALTTMAELTPAVISASEIQTRLFDGSRGMRIDTPEASTFWENTEEMADEYEAYYEEHGTLPPAALERQIYINNHPEAAKKLMLSEDSHFQTLTPAEQNAIYQNAANIPAGVNLVGLSDSGEYILESSGINQTRFLQDPDNGEIMAEKFEGIIDNEDLRTDNWYLAQVYAFYTNGSITKSPFLRVAQDAERAGSMATSKLMSNCLIASNRNPQRTMSTNEGRQWEQVGQMCNRYDITLDNVFARLSGGPRLDGTVNPNPTDNGLLLVNILETAVAGNYAGFEELMGINTPNRMA